MQLQTLVLAALGGLILGCASVAKFLITGRILGISGTVRGGLVKGDWASWRLLFNVGLLAGGWLASWYLPQAFEQLPSSYGAGRAALGGLLVGVGTSLGNGCTSGHGICGNARFSVRSMAYTLTFMAAGITAAALTNSAGALRLSPPGDAADGWAATPPLERGLTMLLASLLSMGTLLQLAHWRDVAAQHAQLINQATELVAGGAFAAGLALSGMTRPSKVVAFLSALHPAWDASLMVVMMAALAVTTPAFQWALRRSGSCPTCAPKYQLPASDAIDARLLAGGVLFGAGWGVSGLCPGPALASLAVPQLQTLAYLCSMVAGMYLEHALVGCM